MNNVDTKRPPRGWRQNSRSSVTGTFGVGVGGGVILFRKLMFSKRRFDFIYFFDLKKKIDDEFILGEREICLMTFYSRTLEQERKVKHCQAHN